MNFLLKVNRLGGIVAINDVHGEYVKWRCNGDFEENTLEFSTGWSTSGTYVSYEYTGIKKHPMPGNRLTDIFWHDYRNKWVGDYICSGYYLWGDDSMRFENETARVTKWGNDELNLSFDFERYQYFPRYGAHVEDDGTLRVTGYAGEHWGEGYISRDRVYYRLFDGVFFTGYRQH